MVLQESRLDVRLSASLCDKQSLNLFWGAESLLDEALSIVNL
jgi:hypothetical protein